MSNDIRLSLLVVLLFVILRNEHLWRYTYEYIANGGPLPTRVQTFRFVRSTLLFYRIIIKLSTLYVKKNVTEARTLLLARHFDARSHNISRPIS